MGHVLLVSSIPSDSYNHLTPYSKGLPELRGEVPNENLQIRLFLHKISSSGTLILLPYGSQIRLSNDNWKRYPSKSIAEYC